MADDESVSADRRDNTSVFDAIEALRSDVREDGRHMREDLVAVEGRMREDLAKVEGRVMATLTDYIRVHSDDHTAQRRESEAAHERFTAFVRATELNQARRDGAIGVLRYGVELFARHAKPLALLLGSAAAFVGVASGAIHIEVIAR